MDNKTINWREEVIKLFPETTKRTKGDHDEWCSVCNGLGLVRGKNTIMVCHHCYGKGIIKSCECGNKIEIKGYTICESCRKQKEIQKDKERFEKAEKINYKDYEGKFLWNERVIDKEELEDELYGLIYDNEDTPNYIYATIKEKMFDNIDLCNVVGDECEDGYEDMSSYFNYKDEKFIKAQELLNEWIKEHDSFLDVYYESNEIILLNDIIEEIKNEINKNGRNENEIFEMVDKYETKLKYAADNTSLPERPNFNKVEELVVEINKRRLL